MRAGIREFEFKSGGKHPRVVFQKDGRNHMVVYSSSTSNGWRQTRDSLSDLRRILGHPNEGAPTGGVVRQPRPKRYRKRLVAVPDAPEALTIRENPFASLLLWKPPSRFTWRRQTNRTWVVTANG
jgi:hypothetical protein